MSLAKPLPSRARSVDVRREPPEPWATAMRKQGMVHGQRPSFAQLATAARQHTESKTLTNQAVIDIVTGKTRQPADDIVRALALALGEPVQEVARWIGRPLESGVPYVPPNGSDRLTRRQRDAVDTLIRVMIDDEGEAGHGQNKAPIDDAGGTPVTELTPGSSSAGREQGTESDGQDLPLASHPKAGRESTGRRLRADLDEVGEGNQDMEQGE